MTTLQVIGAVLFFGTLGGLFMWTSRDFGWQESVIVFALSMFLTVVIAIGAGLMTGAIP